MSEVEYAELFWQGRMFNTKGYLTKEQVKEELPHLDDIDCKDGIYYGCLITDNPLDLAQAERLAEERGYSERVLGVPKLVFDDLSLIAINYN